MKSYGLVGGTFNPIHLMHLYIAYEAYEQLNLDKIIFIPAGNPPHKNNNIILDAKKRYEMVSVATKSYENFIVSDYEIKKNELSYTYETLKFFKEDNVNLYFISGADSLMNIEKWKNPESILNDCTFVAFNRGEYNKDILIKQKRFLQNKYNANIKILDIENMDISSSIIRKRIGEGKRVDFFLSQPILEYIKKENLYCRS